MDIDEDIQALLDERKRTMAAFVPGYDPLKMYALYRADLEMSPGKLAAQCGHAYLDAYEQALKLRPQLTAQYRGTGHGTKICAYQKNLGQLLRTYREIKELGLPCALIIDRGHLLPPHFDGNPLITALGIGPVYSKEIEKQLKRCTLTK